MDTLEAMACPCGCGQWADISHDPETEGWWEVDDETVCYAGQALQQWRDDKGPEQMEQGAIPVVRLEAAYWERTRR